MRSALEIAAEIPEHLKPAQDNNDGWRDLITAIRIDDLLTPAERGVKTGVTLLMKYAPEVLR